MDKKQKNSVDIKKFHEIYEKLPQEASTIITSYFKNYIDKVCNKTQLFATAMITGYFFRVVEERILSKKLIDKPKPFNPKFIESILTKKDTQHHKVEELCNYFDNQKTLLLGEPIKPFVILPYDDANKYFTSLIEDYINSSYTENIKQKLSIEQYYEIIFRNALCGYYYRVAEGLIYL